MKKIGKIALILLIILTISGCRNKVGYTEITYNELMKKLENKDSFILTIGSSNCSRCEEFKFTLEEINKKYSIDVKIIDITKIDETENANLKSHFSYTGTPTTISVVDGVETDLPRIIGSKDYSYVKEKLIKWGYIKE